MWLERRARGERSSEEETNKNPSAAVWLQWGRDISVRLRSLHPYVAETINNGRGEQQAAPSPPNRQLIMDAQEVPVSIRNWMTPVWKAKTKPASGLEAQEKRETKKGKIGFCLRTMRLKGRETWRQLRSPQEEDCTFLGEPEKRCLHLTKA